jgi:hypothetical protein
MNDLSSKDAVFTYGHTLSGNGRPSLTATPVQDSIRYTQPVNLR